MDRIILNAKDGYIYTNGIEYGYMIFLGDGDSQENWREIPIEEYNEIMRA